MINIVHLYLRIIQYICYKMFYGWYIHTRIPYQSLATYRLVVLGGGDTFGNIHNYVPFEELGPEPVSFHTLGDTLDGSIRRELIL